MSTNKSTSKVAKVRCICETKKGTFCKHKASDLIMVWRHVHNKNILKQYYLFNGKIY